MKPFAFRPHGASEFVMCWGKKKFATEKLARDAHGTHRPYHCPHCGQWHLTSQVEQKPKNSGV
jgi:hypothetical protein